MEILRYILVIFLFTVAHVHQGKPMWLRLWRRCCEHQQEEEQPADVAAGIKEAAKNCIVL